MQHRTHDSAAIEREASASARGGPCASTTDPFERLRELLGPTGGARARDLPRKPRRGKSRLLIVELAAQCWRGAFGGGDPLPNA